MAPKTHIKTQGPVFPSCNPRLCYALTLLLRVVKSITFFLNANLLHSIHLFRQAFHLYGLLVLSVFCCSFI